jgi:hypothetical protein
VFTSRYLETTFFPGSAIPVFSCNVTTFFIMCKEKGKDIPVTGGGGP